MKRIGDLLEGWLVRLMTKVAIQIQERQRLIDWSIKNDDLFKNGVETREQALKRIIARLDSQR